MWKVSGKLSDPKCNVLAATKVFHPESVLWTHGLISPFDRILPIPLSREKAALHILPRPWMRALRQAISSCDQCRDTEGQIWTQSFQSRVRWLWSRRGCQCPGERQRAWIYCMCVSSGERLRLFGLEYSCCDFPRGYVPFLLWVVPKNEAFLQLAPVCFPAHYHPMLLDHCMQSMSNMVICWIAQWPHRVQ